MTTFSRGAATTLDDGRSDEAGAAAAGGTSAAAVWTGERLRLRLRLRLRCVIVECAKVVLAPSAVFFLLTQS